MTRPQPTLVDGLSHTDRRGDALQTGGNTPAQARSQVDAAVLTGYRAPSRAGP
jgi:hypothetical protein